MGKPKNGADQPLDAAQPQAPAPEKPAEPDYLDQLLRLKAEFENYRKRVDREKPEYLRLGKAAVLGQLLPLYDLLQKAHQEVQAAHNDTPLAKGMEGIFKEFDKLFKAEGVVCMSPLGKPYDTMLHEVVAAIETNDAPEGSVVAVLQTGFMIGDRVLRPARVQIARGAGAAKSADVNPAPEK